MSRFTLIAHRGLSAGAPENTDASFGLAIVKGLRNIELDVQLTSDDVPVVIHDSTIDRTTDGRGRVADLSLRELQLLDAGAWFDAKFAGEKMMTLTDVLDKYADLAHLHIELKSEQVDLPNRVAEEIKKTGLLELHANEFDVPGITITSFYLAQLQRSIKIIPQFMHGWLVDRIDESVMNIALENGITQLCPKAENITADMVAMAVERGISVRGWGVRTEDDLRQVYEAGASGATANDVSNMQFVDQSSSFETI